MTRRPGKNKRENATAARYGLRLLLVLTVLLATVRAGAQIKATDSVRLTPPATDSVKISGNDSLLSGNDSLRAARDSANRVALEDSLGIRISPDALPAIVEATATDSAILQLRRNQFYLFGDVVVTYEDLKLNAGKVTYDQKAGIIFAEPTTDSAKQKGLPTFTQGSEKFTYDDLRYNFSTKKALVRNARTQYGEGFVFSDQVKRSPDQSIFGLQSVYTTCNLDTPHFGIRSRRIKVIPGRIAVAGSSNFEIEQVPTPLFLPFALFPISEQQRSGFRIPSYTIEQARGVGLTNGGYYVYFSDKADLLITSNIYSRGSFNVSPYRPTPIVIATTAVYSLPMATTSWGKSLSRAARSRKHLLSAGITAATRRRAPALRSTPILTFRKAIIISATPTIRRWCCKTSTTQA